MNMLHLDTNGKICNINLLSQPTLYYSHSFILVTFPLLHSHHIGLITSRSGPTFPLFQSFAPLPLPHLSAPACHQLITDQYLYPPYSCASVARLSSVLTHRYLVPCLPFSLHVLDCLLTLIFACFLVALTRRVILV